MENIAMSTTGGKKSLLNQLWKMYIPYWPVFILLLGVAYGTAWYYLSTQPPLYESKARLLIKDEKKGMDDSKMIESLNLISTKKIVENEIELLTSRSLMSEVVLGLKLYAPIYFKGKWRDSSGYSSSSIKIDVRDPSILSEYSKIGFKEDTVNAAIIIGGKSYRMNEWVNTSYGTLKFTRSKTKNPSTHPQQYFSLINPKEVTRSLMSKLEVTSSSKLSTVIDLKLKDEDPVLAEDVLNELIRSYNRAAVNDKNALTGNTLKFVQERLNIVGRHLNSIQKKIQQYKSDKGAVDISSQGKLFLENVSENDQKVSDVNMQLAVLDQVEKYVEQNNPNGGIVPSTLGIKDPLLSDLLEKLYDAELEKEKLKRTTGENSPLMESLSNQIDKIKPSIHENIRSQRRSLEATRTNLASTNSSYSTLLQSIPQKERDLVEISRQENIENTIYEFLLQKREEAALSNSSTVADNRVVDLAESTLKPVSPNRKLIYVISVIIALGTAAFIIAAKELFSSKILYRTEIETLSSYPVVAEIGYEKTKKQVVIHNGIKGSVAEQFRKLRASLGFLGINSKRRKLLITSAIPGEGKSFITTNLALTLALGGKKVVIVDADLSNPSLSEKLNLTSDKGLSTYLSGEHEQEEIIKKSGLNDNLFIIPAGSVPTNPSELILDERMGELLEYLQEVFNYVLIDSAPVEALSDAYVLSPLCDATLYVVRHGFTPKTAVERLDKTTKVNKLKNVGIVFNGVLPRGFGKNNSGYGYSYHLNRENKRKPLQLFKTGKA